MILRMLGILWLCIASTAGATDLAEQQSTMERKAQQPRSKSTGFSASASFVSSIEVAPVKEALPSVKSKDYVVVTRDPVTNETVVIVE